MTIEETVVTVLQGRGAKVYPLRAPEDTPYPFIVYQFISTLPIRAHGESVMDRVRLQVSVWSKSYDQCVTITQNVKAALNFNQTNFKLATRENEFDTTDPEPGLYRKLLEFFIWHTEGV
ncbi:MAG TPA: DUF3168 domain-containing protein [Anaerolineales bacterium]|nr:DUF3168 domain-containing protein [Anaerolineales bacterium]